MSKLILLVQPTDLASEERIGKMIASQGGAVGWMRYTPGAWLISDTREKGPTWWRQQIRTLDPDVTVIVTELTVQNWSAFCNKAGIQWLTSHWQPPPPPLKW